MVAPLLRAAAAGAAKNAGKKAAKAKAAKKISKADVLADRALRKEYRASLKTSLQAADDFLSNANNSDENKRRVQNFRDSVQRTIDDSYAGKKGGYSVSTSRLQTMKEVASEMVDNGFDDTSLRKRKMFERDINQASIGGVSTKTKEEVKIFYADTKDIWGGHDITQRHKQLMLHFGVNDLQEVWDIVFSDPIVQESLKKAQKAQERMQSSKDAEDGSTDETEEKGSPDYIKELITDLDTARKTYSTKMAERGL